MPEVVLPRIVDVTTTSGLVALIVCAVFLLFFDLVLFLLLKKVSVLVASLVLHAGIIASACFDGLSLLFYILIATSVIYLIGVIFCNIGSLRWFFSAPGSKGNGPIGRFKKGKEGSGYDQEAVYEKVKTAVMTLSRQKIGALITFQKRDDLTELIKNGTAVNAPVTSELLQTIFYPGTRLHDGAVVIRGDKIIAASVYFTPTNRPLTGKYGSRHRAAFGICETTDSVTIVVSEETGRISIAYEGDLTSVNPDNFMRIFRECMEGSDKETDE